jgi:tetratricopeptide (TPR) repeat protein
MATLLLLQEQASQSAEIQSQASQLAQQAIQLDNDIVSKYPNNIVFWKNRVRIFYTLSQIQPQYLQDTVNSMKTVSTLAPTDAKVMYNLGVIYKTNANLSDAKAALEKAVLLKPDYRDAYYALGLTLHEMASDNGRVVNQELENQAITNMKYVLEHIAPQDKEVQDVLKSWNAL